MGILRYTAIRPGYRDLPRPQFHGAGWV